MKKEKIQKNTILILMYFFFRLNSLQAQLVPQDYNQSNLGQFKNAIKELQKLHLLGTETILDVGSGDGRVSTHIAQHYVPNGKLIGIDNNAEMVAFASSHATENNTEYMQADIADYVSANTYDVIVSFWTLHWVTEYEKALQKIAQSLKLNGKALICHVVRTDPLEPIVCELLNTKKWGLYKKDYISLLNIPSFSQIACSIEKSQLAIESLEIKKNGEWTPLEIMKMNLLSLPIFYFIPVHTRAEFCDEVLKQFITKYPLNEKGEVFDWLPVIVMILKK